MTTSSMSWTGHQNNRSHYGEEWQQVPGNVKVNNMSIFLFFVAQSIMYLLMPGLAQGLKEVGAATV